GGVDGAGADGVGLDADCDPGGVGVATGRSAELQADKLARAAAASAAISRRWAVELGIGAPGFRWVAGVSGPFTRNRRAPPAARLPCAPGTLRPWRASGHAGPFDIGWSGDRRSTRPLAAALMREALISQHADGSRRLNDPPRMAHARLRDQ